jgi:hypothetical protein
MSESDLDDKRRARAEEDELRRWNAGDCTVYFAGTLRVTQG